MDFKSMMDFAAHPSNDKWYILKIYCTHLAASNCKNDGKMQPHKIQKNVWSHHTSSLDSILEWVEYSCQAPKLITGHPLA